MQTLKQDMPITTRLRYVSSTDLMTIEDYFRALGIRVQIYAINFVKGRWYVHFVPPDRNDIDVKSIDL